MAEEESESESELYLALKAGDLDRIRSLLDAGADVRYVSSHNYTCMVDVLHGPAITDDQLLPILQLLIVRGADLDTVTDYGESALSVTSNWGRFDAVELLLDAGADPEPLQWTFLMHAVAIGSLDDVRQRIELGDDLTERDRWERTAWLVSVYAGDIAKAELLLAAGADRTDRGRGGVTALMASASQCDSAMLRWLLDLGLDPNETKDSGESPLICAAIAGDVDCVRLLLDAGADLHQRSFGSAAIASTSSVEVVRALVAAGADLNDINKTMRSALTGVRRDRTFRCTLEEYEAAKHRRFGTTNPEKMNFPFWQTMVTSGVSAYLARDHFEPGQLSGRAVWCFQRYGISLTELPDGRVIEIAGAHEDYCDADFCIYNDVIVHHGNGTFDIYGYPKDIFPPTDFHTATLIGNSIYIIGSPGYAGERQFGVTPVYRLDIDTLAIESIETTGVLPGWIFEHNAKLIGNGIEITGGKISGPSGNPDNTMTYVLNLATWTWSIVEHT